MIQRIKKRVKQYEKIICYLIAGVLTTVVSLAIYYICTIAFLDPSDVLQLQAANVISWIGAVTFAYVANRQFVFKSKNTNIIREMSSFYFARIGSLLIEMAIMFIAVTLVGVNDKIAKMLVQIIVTIVNYLFSKVFVFLDESHKEIDNGAKRGYSSKT